MSRISLLTFSRRMYSKMIDIPGIAGRRMFVEKHPSTSPGRASRPSIVYVPGFMSSSKGTKCRYLIQHCQQKGYEFVCYDPEGNGNSPADIESLELEHWFEDCQYAIDQATSDRVLLVGSSIGGWISLKKAIDFPNRIAALLLIAPAHNIIWQRYRSIYNALPPEAQRKLDEGGEHAIRTEKEEAMTLRKAFAESSRKMEIDLSEEIPIDCPVRIIHGVKDESVPYTNSIELMEKMRSKDVDLLFRKNGSHRLNDAGDLELLVETLDRIMESLDNQVPMMNCNSVK